jgi:hypothetical protein
VITSSFVVPSGGIFADRFLFFPSYWLVTIAAIGGTHLARSAAPRAALLAVTTLGLAYPVAQIPLTILTARNWRNDESLFLSAFEMCPNNHRIRLDKAVFELNAGRRRESAWNLLVTSAILLRFPRPLPEDFVPPAWESLPVDERVALLRARLGGDAELEAVRHFAVGLGNHYHYFEPVAELLVWPSPIGTMPWEEGWTQPADPTKAGIADPDPPRPDPRARRGRPPP